MFVLRVGLAIALVLSLVCNAGMFALCAWVAYVANTAIDELILYQSGEVILTEYAACAPTMIELQAAHQHAFDMASPIDHGQDGEELPNVAPGE